jgi:hypothetical protein
MNEKRAFFAAGTGSFAVYPDSHSRIVRGLAAIWTPSSSAGFPEFPRDADPAGAENALSKNEKQGAIVRQRPAGGERDRTQNTSFALGRLSRAL